MSEAHRLRGKKIGAPIIETITHDAAIANGRTVLVAEQQDANATLTEMLDRIATLEARVRELESDHDACVRRARFGNDGWDSSVVHCHLEEAVKLRRLLGEIVEGDSVSDICGTL